MKTASKLKLCNKSLGLLLVLMLVSGVQLEATSGKYPWSVWMHILLGILLCILVGYHIYLHYKSTNWLGQRRSSVAGLTKIFD